MSDPVKAASSNMPLIIGGVVLLMICSSSSALMMTSNASSNVSVVSKAPAPATVPVVAPTPGSAAPTPTPAGSAPVSQPISSTPAPVPAPAPAPAPIFNGETYTFQNPFKVRMNAPSGSWMCVNGDQNNLGERRINVWPNTAGTAGQWQISPVPGQPANVFHIKNILRSDPKFTSGAYLCVNGDPGSTKADYNTNLWPNPAGEAGCWIIEQVPGQPGGTYSCKNLFKINQQAEAPFLAVNGNPNDLGNPWTNVWRDAGGDAAWWTIAKV